MDRLWQLVSAQFYSSGHSVHGPDHWRRVERNGLLLATRTGADIAIVRLFALFHDSRRENEDRDDGHGARGAEYASALRGIEYDLPDERFDLLHYACVWHTRGGHHTDSTIATCWDADRLDLGRVGIIPSPEFMSADFGREIAAYGSIQPFIRSAATEQPENPHKIGEPTQPTNPSTPTPYLPTRDEAFRIRISQPWRSYDEAMKQAMEDREPQSRERDLEHGREDKELT